MLGLLGRIWGGPVVYRDGAIEVRERNGVRTLHLGSETIQSAMRVAEPDALELSYTRAMMAFLLFVEPPAHALMIGLGGGSLAKFLYRKLPQTRLRVLEIDAAVADVALRYFALPRDSERMEIVIDDGAAHVSKTTDTVDALFIDAYDARALARSFTEDAFYKHARRILVDAGVMVMNLWASDLAFDRNLQRIERAFSGRCLCLPAERPGNVIVLAFATVPVRMAWNDLAERARQLEDSIGMDFSRLVHGLRKMNRHDAHGLHLDAA